MENFIGRNIRAFRNHKGLTQDEFAAAVGISQTSSSAWEDGTSLLRMSNADNLFEAFPELSFDDVFSAQLGFARKVLNRETGADVVNVPVYGSIAAGAPIEMIQAEGKMPVSGRLYNEHPRSFFLRVKGESMNRSLPNGCVALVDPDADFVDGKIYAVRVEKTDATVKIVHRAGSRVELIPDSYDSRFKKYSYRADGDGEDSVEILGRVVWYCAPFDFGR